MKKLIFGLLVLGAVLLVALAYGDVQAREYAEEHAEERLAAAVPMVAGADVEIDAFPFVGWVLVDGSVERLDVELTDLHAEGITVERVALTIHGLKLDRDRLVDEQEITILGLERAQLEGSITSQAVDRVTPVPTKIRDGEVEVTYRGHTLGGSIELKKRDVVIEVAGMHRMKVPLPSKKYLPCDPALKLEGERLKVSCMLHELPPAVAEVLGRH